MSCGSCVPMTFCGLTSWSGWIAVLGQIADAVVLNRTLSRTKSHGGLWKLPRSLDLWPRMWQLARDVARVQGHLVSKEEDSGPHGWLAHVGRSFDVSRWKVGGFALGAKS